MLRLRRLQLVEIQYVYSIYFYVGVKDGHFCVRNFSFSEGNFLLWESLAK